MFKKLICIESSKRMDEESLENLKSCAEQVILYDDIPNSQEEIQSRIGDADAILVSTTSHITGEILLKAPNLRYIGMCCSLYDPKSANVDIIKGNELGIVTTGVHNYGDRGVPEYVVSDLIRLLHGFYGPMWRNEPYEIAGQKAGLLGLGTTGKLIAEALSHFGADIFYYSRMRKSVIEAEKNFTYLPLDELLNKADILCCCLNKNTILLHRREFELFGNGKILINTSIGPAYDLDALYNWLNNEGNYLLVDHLRAVGFDDRIKAMPNLLSPMVSSGMTAQAKSLLGRKVIENIREFLSQE